MWVAESNVDFCFRRPHAVQSSWWTAPDYSSSVFPVLKPEKPETPVRDEPWAVGEKVGGQTKSYDGNMRILSALQTNMEIKTRVATGMATAKFY